MARLVSLQWDSGEALIAVASAHASRCTLEDAFVVPLASPPGKEDIPASSEAPGIGQQIGEAMVARGITCGDALLVVGRSSVELRQLTLPPAPDEELPDLVRLQAMRDFNALDESWLIDYIPMPSAPDQPRGVLAAAMAPHLADRLQAECEAAGLKAKGLILRPCAEASLLDRLRPEGVSRLRLLVNLCGEEADLTATLNRTVVFLRTARLPGDPATDPQAVRSLVTEIRRTIAAVPNQLAGRAVELVVICGNGKVQAELCETLGQALTIPVERFDPLAGFEISQRLRTDSTLDLDRFAPLLGSLLDEASQTAHAIDFLHPRRPPSPPNRRRQYAIAAAAVFVAILTYVGYTWWQGRALDAEIALLNQQLKDLDSPLSRADKAAAAVAEIVKWTAGEVNWLDELRDLCSDVPPAQEMMLTQVTMASSSVRGGEMRLEGMTRAAGNIDAAADRVRDATHRVEIEKTSVDESIKGYAWRFVATLFINAEKR